MFSTHLLLLEIKKDGGIWPIVVGNVFRRSAAKIVCKAVTKDIGERLFPIQLWFGVSGGMLLMLLDPFSYTILSLLILVLNWMSAVLLILLDVIMFLK